MKKLRLLLVKLEPEVEKPGPWRHFAALGQGDGSVFRHRRRNGDQTHCEKAGRL